MNKTLIIVFLLLFNFKTYSQAKSFEDPIEISTVEGAEILILYGLETFVREGSIGTKAHIEEIFINNFEASSAPKAYIYLNGRPFLVRCEGRLCHLKVDPTSLKTSLYSFDILKIMDSGKELRGKIELEVELNGNLKLTDPKTGAKVFKLEIKDRTFSVAG